MKVRNIYMLGMAFCMMLFFNQQAFGQAEKATDQNGRHQGTSTDKPVLVDQPVLKSGGDDLTQIDDADIPGTYFLDGSQEDDVIIGEGNPADNLLKRLDALESELEDLRLYNEQLATENENMKMEMANCCSEAASNLNIANSFLLQNSPNPYIEETKFQFFISDTAANAKLEVRTVEGVLLKSFTIDQTGLGEMTVDSKAFGKGSYVYTLSVDGKIIDSKVMIQQ